MASRSACRTHRCLEPMALPQELLRCAELEQRRSLIAVGQIVWGSNIGFEASPAGYGDSVRSNRELVIAGEPVKDRSAANLVVGEIGHPWGVGLGLGR
jgi:hypothetical protein